MYRVWQFAQAVGAWVQPEDVAAVQRWLPPEGVALFRAMPRYDRQHALRVARALEQAGHTAPDLLAAALLHDVGKTAHTSAPLRLWHRVAVVLLRRFWPDGLQQLAKDRPGSWRQPFYVQQHHAAIGAELGRQAGCSPRTVDLIRRHKDPPHQVDDPWLSALQAADGVS